jgi:hypothetical protein
MYFDKKFEGQSNIHFSQTDTKRVIRIGSLGLIIYLSILLSFSCLVLISVAAQSVA